ncbi:E3 ubiquitin-protein ligase MARCHF5 [Pseudocercospora fuligena]|uniref:E3 ubiquitin-protein ligase MARCHF5 n=1 Tax=Pseudocercospora fuligena TaxID=685502 RepID=A0A8H6VJ79_9PEZI|nr:E3 ubiquitin-protein ligase MARCHF5 [Pseudocercospora fuligena]
MASMPARQPQRRASRPDVQSQSPTQNRSPVRSRSEDSQTIFVHEQNDDEEHEEQEQKEQTDEASTQVQAATSPSPYNPADDPSIKKCWICFSDETEDTPETSPWRDPCPCALVAHEECLLDWIADMEAPNTRDRRAGITAPKIECPQCKSEITLARPHDIIVEAVRGLERIGSKFIIPASGSALFAALHSISMSVGIHSVYAVFGADDGFRILRPLFVNTIRPPVETYVGRPGEASEQILRVFLDHAVHWRLYLGLPLITPLLVLSRTSIADSILPVLPIVFFASQAHSPDDALDFAQWPPSASFAFAVLPYVRSLYNAYYQRVWAEREKRWLREIQPRSQEQQEGDEAAPGNAEQPGPEQRDGENVFEIRVDGGLWDQWDEEEERLVQEAADRNPPGNPLEQVQEQPDRLIQAQAEPPPDIQDNRPQAQQAQPQAAAANGQQQQNQANANVDRRISFSPTGIAETVIGALLFPTISGLAGEALKLVLPRSWTTPPVQFMQMQTVSGLSFRGPRKAALTGFLQAKWARSLVGGCLFVVCKDALVLYVRWKMAQMHRRRRVVDVDRKKLNAEKASTRT